MSNHLDYFKDHPASSESQATNRHRNLDKHEVDELISEAYKKGWNDALATLSRHNDLIQGR